MKYVDPDGRTDSDNTVVWTAKETLVLFGSEMRAGLSGMTMLSGYADVEFTNGTESFSKRFEVISVYSEGLFFSTGQTTSQTTYTKSFSENETQQGIIDSYEGIFATIGVSGSTPAKFTSFGVGKTFAVDFETQDIDPNGWSGITKSASISLDTGFSFGLGTQITVYRDPDKENNTWSDHPEWFYYKPLITNNYFEDR